MLGLIDVNHRVSSGPKNLETPEFIGTWKSQKIHWVKQGISRAAFKESQNKLKYENLSGSFFLIVKSGNLKFSVSGKTEKSQEFGK